MPFGKGRQPDKPGTYRVRPSKDGGFKLSGVKADGTRVRMNGFASSKQAEDLASTLFPKTAAVVQAVTDWGQTDDWGLPALRVSDETIGSVAQTLNIPDPTKPAPSIAIIPDAVEPPKPTPEEKEKKERNTKNAKSLMDLVGLGVAVGDVMIGRKLCEAVGKDEIAKPDPKHVNDLRENTREALKELFGDSEIEPWKMAILLALGIPLAMLIQSKSKPKPKEGETNDRGNLKSVP